MKRRRYGKTLAAALVLALLAAQPAAAAEISQGAEQSAGNPWEAVGFAKREEVHVGVMPGGGMPAGPGGSSAGGPGMAASQNGGQGAGPEIQDLSQGPGAVQGQPGAQDASQAQAQPSEPAPVVPIDPQTGQPLYPQTPETPPESQDAGQAGNTSSGGQVDSSRPMVALTFDDGPQTSVGNRIMDCLAQYGGKATFFMVGDRVASRAAEVKRMVAEGHEVANHTMNHKYLQSLGAAAIQAQVSQCNDAIEAACGVRPTLMRLPGGNHNATVLANTHMPMIQWSIDTLDWKTRNAASTVSKVLNNVKDGDIVLMHELYSQTGDAALQIIPELVNRGFQLVTVSEMAAAKGKTLQAGKLYSSFR